MEKTFYCLNKAYYAKDTQLNAREAIMISISGCGEFAIEWVNVCGESLPQIRAFLGSWKTLSLVPELLELGISDYTQEAMIKFLLELGYIDNTLYENPFLSDERQQQGISREVLLFNRLSLLEYVDKIEKVLNLDESGKFKFK